jgi:hypothetical protein
MLVKIIRKLLLVLLVTVPLFYIPGCKKQVKCGCGNDVLFTLTDQEARVYYNENGTNIYCILVNDSYSTYHFCNPGEMFPKLTDYKSGDILLVSGSVYWECNYLYQASNYTYQPLYKVYMIEAANVYINLYGKK